jgi:SAM-dependent methyltransferase
MPPSIRPQLRLVYRAAAANPLRTRAAKARLKRELNGAVPPVLEAVDTKVWLHDGMWLGRAARRYFHLGLASIRCIDDVYRSTGAPSPKRILDMPSGAGRVLRFIAVRFPQAELTACDIMPDHVAFCARRFGARPVVSSPDFDAVELPGPFDLIWSGSLVSHLDSESTKAYLGLCRRNLSATGMMILTTHGAEVARRIPKIPAFYGLTDQQAKDVVSAYERDEIGFIPYSTPHTPQVLGYTAEAAPYGIALTSPEWIRGAAAQTGLSEQYFAEHGLNAHHDVFAFAAD